MKQWIVSHLLLSYDSKVFGKKFRHLRCANTLVPLFVLAMLFTAFTGEFGLWDLLAWFPFVFTAVFVSTYKISEKDHPYLDWEQQYQLANKPVYAKNRLVLEEEEFKNLEVMFKQKYEGKEKFVHAFRFFHPILWIIGGATLYGVFGVADDTFPDLRGF